MPEPTPLERNLLTQMDAGHDPTGSELFLAMIARGPLDVEAFAGAIRDLPSHNDGLRTGFRRDLQGDWERFVLPEATLPVEILDLRECADPTGEANEAVRAFRHQGIDVGSPPLARVLLVRIGDDETWFIRHASHVALDGWSVVLINQELTERYAALVEGRAPRLPPRRDGADLARALQDPPAPASLAYWQEQTFAGAELATDHPVAPGSGTPAAHLTAMTPHPVSAGLEAACKRLGVSIRAPLCLAWARALAPLCTAGEGGLHVAFANRKDPARRGTVCYLSVSVPLMVPVEDDETTAQLQATMARLRAHQDHIDALPEKPRSQSIVDYHHVADYAAGLDLPGVAFHPHAALPADVHHMYVHYRVELHSVRMFGTLVHLVRYRRDLFDPPTIQALIDRFAAELARIAEACA